MSSDLPSEARFGAAAEAAADRARAPARSTRRPSGWYFLRKFLRDPGGVSAIWPSGPVLGRCMVDGIRLGDGEWIVEYGPGTGGLTEAMADLVRRSPGARYLGIERDPEFTNLLQQRFPGLVFVCADARDVASVCGDVGCERMRAVVSGLPFVRMRPADVGGLLERTHALLAADGIFRNFTYAHTLVTPGSARLRRELKRLFDDYELRGPILRNLPPAVVMSARKRRACASRPSC